MTTNSLTSDNAFGEPALGVGGAPTTGLVRIGTRGSALALAQARLVAGMLGEWQIPAQLVVIRTQGDADQTKPLAVIGGQGVFTSALQDALLRNEIDLAVHAAKDLPTAEHPDLELIAFLSRQDPRDVLISTAGPDLASLPPGARVGTSSRRRIAQLLAVRPDLEIVDLRGNIDTRIRGATDGDLDAVVLAAAGLHRLGWHDRITAYLPLGQFVPAPGQAALALEIRRYDPGPAARAVELNEPAVSVCVRAERAFLRAIGAGCTTPVGAHATLEGDGLRLRAMVASPELTERRWSISDIDRHAAEAGAARMARELAGLVRADRRSRRTPVLGGGQRPTVLVTRPGHAGAGLGRAVVEVGAIAIVEPMLLVEPVRGAAVDDALRWARISGFDWVAFTSANAVEGVIASLPDANELPVAFGDARLAVVGEATAAGLRAAGLEPAVVAGRSDAEGLAAAMVRTGVAGDSVWLPSGNLNRTDLADALTAAGASVTVTEVYHVDTPVALSKDTHGALLQGDIDAVLFASPSAARHLVNLLGPDRATLDDTAIVAIGEMTASEVRKLGLAVAAVARTPSDDGLIDGLWRALEALTPPNRPVSPGGLSGQEPAT